jgi:hypothetical protein
MHIDVRTRLLIAIRVVRQLVDNSDEPHMPEKMVRRRRYLKEPFNTRRRMFWACTVQAMGKHENNSTLLEPFC